MFTLCLHMLTLCLHCFYIVFTLFTLCLHCVYIVLTCVYIVFTLLYSAWPGVALNSSSVRVMIFLLISFRFPFSSKILYSILVYMSTRELYLMPWC